MMKTKIYWLFFCLLFSASLLEAQDNPTLKWLQDRIGEWEAVNDSGDTPAIEAYRHEYESVMGGQGILFKSKAKFKGQDWMTAVTVLWGAVQGTDKLYAIGVPAAGVMPSSMRSEGILVDDSFNLKIFPHADPKNVQADIFYTGTGDEYKLHGTQYMEGKATPLTPLIFKKIK